MAVPDPLFVGCDPDGPALFPLPGSPRPEPGLGLRYHLNQVSPTGADLLIAIDAILDPGHGPKGWWQACRRDGALAMRLHDKAQAIDALGLSRPAAAGEALPPCAPTAILPLDGLLALPDWASLAAAYRAGSGDAAPGLDGLVVKSSRDSAGNGAALFTEAGFGEARARIAAALGGAAAPPAPEDIAEAQRDIAASPFLDAGDFPPARLAAFEARRRARRAGLSLLVQRRIEPPAAPDRRRPLALGLSFHLAEARIDTVAVAAQTYHDPGRAHFRGALLDRALEEDYRGSRFAAQMNGLCRRLQALGYRGPVNFDALLDRDGRYVLIHDCNPRLSAVFPPLALHRALARHRQAAGAVLSLGYRGEYRIADLAATLGALDRAGLLWTSRRRRGLLPLPSLVAEHGFDIAVLGDDAAAVAALAGALPGYGIDTALSPEVHGLPAAAAAPAR